MSRQIADGLSQRVINDLDLRFEPFRKDNDTATSDPTVNNDSSEGYEPFSRWINNTSKEVFVCLDASNGAADWQTTSLTLDDLGTAATKDVGSGASQIRLNSDNEALFTDEQETTDIAVDNAITFSIALG